MCRGLLLMFIPAHPRSPVRLPLVSVMVSAHVALWKLVLIACIKGKLGVLLPFFLCLTFDSGAATTASRLGQPDLAIATMNDFVGVSIPSVAILCNMLTRYNRLLKWSAVSTPAFLSLQMPTLGMGTLLLLSNKC